MDSNNAANQFHDLKNPDGFSKVFEEYEKDLELICIIFQNESVFNSYACHLVY